MLQDTEGFRNEDLNKQGNLCIYMLLDKVDSCGDVCKDNYELMAIDWGNLAKPVCSDSFLGLSVFRDKKVLFLQVLGLMGKVS